MTTIAYGDVQVLLKQNTAELILNRPSARNALSTALALSIAQACADLATRDEVHAVVFRSACDTAFCVGADLKERNSFSHDDFLAQRELFRAAFGGVLRLPMPSIAAVHGWALGGGFELALCCDMIVADETAILDCLR